MVLRWGFNTKSKLPSGLHHTRPQKMHQAHTRFYSCSHYIVYNYHRLYISDYKQVSVITEKPPWTHFYYVRY